ncbi:MAG: efflux RND transporter periplasmic adaptor subunit [Halothiobacillaceae bacterium]|nr:efflux RND transporter periplasmic adaptor subunit [Halothiobacillaceae bacterium]
MNPWFFRLAFGMVCLSAVARAGTPVEGQGFERLHIEEGRLARVDLSLASPERADYVPLARGLARVAVGASGGVAQVVSAPAEGRIVSLARGEGDAVRANEPLLVLDSPARAERVSLWRSARALLEQAQQVLARDRALHAEGLIARKRLEESTLAFAEARNALDAARERLRQLGLSDARIESMSVETGEPAGQLVVRAPVDGRIAGLRVAPGQRVAAADALLSLLPDSGTWLWLPVSASVAAGVRPTDTLRVEGCASSAPVVAVEPRADPQSQTVTLRARMQGDCPALFDGLRVPASLQTRMEGAAWRVPGAALVRREGRDYLFVRDEAGVLVLPVTLLARDGEAVILRGERLSAEVSVVVQGIAQLKAHWLGMGGGE